MQLARRLDKLPPYLFVDIAKKIADKRAKGEDVISFAIGDPDLSTPNYIVEHMCQAAHNPINHHYPESIGLPELHVAIAEWYKKRFGVLLNPENEVLPLIGSKEGIGHIALCMINPGDIALVPNPGYPVYSIGTLLVGGEPYFMPLKEENDYLPDFKIIPDKICNQAKLMWLNYPNNPTGACADIEFFERAIDFAKKYDIAICHDAPYTEVAFDDYQPPSFMEAPGAKDIGVEFHSLSKTYNMTGWRIGMIVGNKKLVEALFRIKSNLDSGIPQAIQEAAIKALTGPQDSIKQQNNILQRRRNKLTDALHKIGLQVTIPKASFYIWAKIPHEYTSIEFTKKLLDETNIAVTPGIGYGNEGEGYIRISMTLADERLEEGIRRLLKWHWSK